MMINRLIPLLTVLTLLTCTGTVVENGGGSEITGRVVTSDAQAAPGTIIRLIGDSASPSFTDTTDEDGRYTFESPVPDGIYTLQGTLDSLAFIAFDLFCKAPYFERTDTLQNTGGIQAAVNLGNSTYSQGIDAYIPGTSFIGKTDSNGTVTLLYVPPGTYEIVFEKTGYWPQKTQVEVYSGMIASIGPLLLQRNPALPVEIPVPTGLSAGYDTVYGIVSLSWSKVNLNIRGYYVRIADPSVDRYPKDGRYRVTRDTAFLDTIFPEQSTDTATVKEREYQVKVIDENNNEGQWGPACSLTVRRPMVPPPPSCSLVVDTKNLAVLVSISTPELRWIDSVMIFRSTTGADPVRIASLPARPDLFWYDRTGGIPPVNDTIICLTYTVFARSRFQLLSEPSTPKSAEMINPSFVFSMPSPARPEGPPGEADAGTYVFRVPAVTSPIMYDTVQYRLIISDSADTQPYFTAWYCVPSIEASLFPDGIRYVQCQARSKRFYGFISSLSDTLKVVVRRSHAIMKPSVPKGEVQVVTSNPYIYSSEYGDSCSLGHAVALRYAVSYQGEAASDSTGWLDVPNSSATIVWARPGIAYLRAQVKCLDDKSIVSPWSDALVVTVE